MSADSVRVDGPIGPLEAIFEGPETDAVAQPVVAVICHPLSTEGGSLHNKVVTMTARALRESGVATVRFNFRSVGASVGSFDHGEGESDDLAAVVAVGLAFFGLGNGSVDVMMNVEATAIEQQMGRTILPVFHAFFSFGTVLGASLRSPDTADALDQWATAQLETVEQALSAWVPAEAPAGLGQVMRYGVLDGITAQTYAGEIEVVVADDGIRRRAWALSTRLNRAKARARSDRSVATTRSTRRSRWKLCTPQPVPRSRAVRPAPSTIWGYLGSLKVVEVKFWHPAGTQKWWVPPG